jgi:hypothetical protein
MGHIQLTGFEEDQAAHFDEITSFQRRWLDALIYIVLLA